MIQKIDLQNNFLKQLRDGRIITTIFLVNGFRISGVIKGFDLYMIEVEADGKQQVVYKHAVSTIAPSKNVKLSTT